MKTHVKLCINTELHPDNITEEQYQQLESHPFWDETDAFGEPLYVHFWLEDYTKIPQTLRDVTQILGVLL